MSEEIIKSVVFISNYFNHHQKPFSDTMYAKLGKGYIFIETESMSEERKSMGYKIAGCFPYVISKEEFCNNKEKYMSIIREADVVIIGAAPNILIKERIKLKKLIFRYSERPLKKGLEIWKYPVRFIRWHRMNPKNANIYMLCASAYTAGDFAKFRLFKNQCYKWGYFPEAKRYDDIDRLILEKKSVSILWVARLIEWKHPEASIEVAKRLKKEGYSFTLNIIGDGKLWNKLKNRIISEKLNDCVHMLGFMKTEEVRKYMERSEILLFTSDKNEGWGAVLNESMNSACAVVASQAIGSVPFLIEDGKNGLIYKDGDIEDLYVKVKKLIDNSQVKNSIGKAAYHTICDNWNAEIAAERLIKLSQVLCSGEKTPDLFKEGICSKAET